METCRMDHSNYLHNGLITQIWGEPTWIANHAITFGYPLQPTEQQKKDYRDYFISLGNVLPCRYCRESYKQFITTGESALTDEVMENRETLTRWLYRIHEIVNRKLEMDYGIGYNDLVERYESFRAKCGHPVKTEKGCIAPLDYKAMSFKKLYCRDCPIISIDLAKIFIETAKKRGLGPEYFSFINLAEKLNGNPILLRKQVCWNDRNKYCFKIIKHMRKNAIPSLETDGPWRGTPTIDELKLIMFLSTNLGKTDLQKIAEKLIIK